MYPGKIAIQISDYGSSKSAIDITYTCYQDTYNRFPDDNTLYSQYRLRLDQIRSKVTQHIKSSFQIFPGNMEINSPVILPRLQLSFMPEPKPEHKSTKDLDDQINILLNEVATANSKAHLTDNRHHIPNYSDFQSRDPETDYEFIKLKEIDNYCKEKVCSITGFLEINQKDYPSSEISQQDKEIISKIIIGINP